MKTIDKEQSKLLYSTSSAAAALDVSRSTIYALMKAGLLKSVPFGADKRIPAEEVERLAKEGVPCAIQIAAARSSE